MTRDYGLPKDRLLVTVFHDDDAAFDLWKKVAGLPDDRIIRIATADNFWMMGPTGPCGPCSEIFYDHGEGIPGGPPGSPDEDGDRFIEIWNLVFMQFEQHEDGSRTDLPRPSIDTGMGLERIGAVLQGKHDNYDTDLMRALIEASANATDGDPDGPGRVHHRVIADHLRSTSFLIADGVLPSNEGRGYVLRRIMRRAMRHAHLLGAEDPVMWRLVPALVAQMGGAFPELTRAEPLIEETLRSEETRFQVTLDRGLRLLDDELARLAEGAPLPGQAAFRLYDTYGFPLDLTQDALRERGRAVDTAGFDAAMAEQKAKARAAWAGSGEAADEAIWFDLAERLGPTEFLGYDTETAEGQILALLVGGHPVESAEVGIEVLIVLNQTPFYAESGGQVGDTGTLRTDKARVRVTDVRKKAGLFVHTGRVEEGTLARGAAAELAVDHDRRSAIRANHSATHLLHEALRRALGDHVAQRGSLVAPDRLRFDFAHPKAMTRRRARRRRGRGQRLRPPEHAGRDPDHDPGRRRGSRRPRALRREVRRRGPRRLDGRAPGLAASAPPATPTRSSSAAAPTSRRTGDIGAFKLVSEAATASGVRRVEALTGAGALAHVAAEEAALGEAAALLRARPDELPERIRALLDERRAQANEIAELRRRLALAGGPAEAKGPETVAGIPFLAQSLAGVSGKDLRGLIDEHKARLGSGVILLVADTGDKAAVAAGVTDDLTARVSAVDLVRVAAEALGGKGGGGRPDMAQAGGADPRRAPQAIAAARALLEAEMEKA